MAAPVEHVLVGTPSRWPHPIRVAAAWAVGALAAGLIVHPLLGAALAALGAIRSRRRSRALMVTLVTLAVGLLAYTVVLTPPLISFGGAGFSEDGGPLP